MTTSSNKLPVPQDDDDPPSIDELLSRAALHIIKGANHLRQAAEDIAAAAARGASQRKIASNVGKSAMWVNALLQWRAGGYQDSAFGPQSKVKRDKAAVQAPVHQPEPLLALPAPFTVKTERKYTKLITERRLREGDCKLSWSQYFEYRRIHHVTCDRLTDKDLAYVRQWTHAGPAPALTEVEKVEEVEAPSITPPAETPPRTEPQIKSPPVIGVATLAAALQTISNFWESNPAWPPAIRKIGKANFEGIVETLCNVRRQYQDKNVNKAAADRAAARSAMAAKTEPNKKLN